MEVTRRTARGVGVRADDRRAVVLGTMTGAASAIGLLALADPSTVRPGGWSTAFIACLVAGGLLALGLVTVGRRWPDPVLAVAVAVAMAVVTLAVLANQDRSAALQDVVLLLPASVFSAVYLTPRTTRLLSAVMVCCIGGLATSTTGDPLQWAVLVALPVLAFTGTTEVVLRMRRHLGGALDALEVQAVTDPLTGLLNRRALHKRLDSGTGVGIPVRSVLALDIDHFKRVNDTYGHAGGDEALVRLADGLRHGTRQEDLVVRLGGEEFLVLSTEPHGSAALFAETLRQRAAEWMAPWSATVSIGLALVPEPTTGGAADLAEALRTADQCLYEAKRTGRDRVVSAPHPAIAG